MTDPRTWPLVRVHNYVLAFLVGTFCVTPVLKLGEIQYLELVFAADFVLLLMVFMWNRLRLKIYRPFISIGAGYLAFMLLAFLLAILALRGYFNPTQFSFFKRPLLVTLSRIVELFLDCFFMLYLASIYRKDEGICRFTCNTYYWMGILGGVYSLISLPFNILYQVQAGAYMDTHRLRGFANEAGNYGPYMLSVILLTVVMYRVGWMTRRKCVLSLLFFGVLLAGTQSKGAFFGAAILSLIQVLLSVSGWKRWLTIAEVVIAIIVVGFVADIPARVDVYVRGSRQYVQLSNIRYGDGNFVGGRIAGGVLAPRMIKAHPVIGIGWGNYPLVRDAPEYRQGTAFALSNFDAPSLGVIDYIVELGVPLWLYLTWMTVMPAYLLRRRKADPWLVGLAMSQPVIILIGMHLNISYPWVAVSLAMGLGFRSFATHKPLPQQQQRLVHDIA